MADKLTPLSQCSANLRAKLLLDEEEALKGNFKVRKPKIEEEAPEKSKGGRWLLDPKFAVPGPFSERPVSHKGKVSFHFAWTVVSKTASGHSSISGRGATTPSDRSISEHDAYVCRDGAVMTIGPASFDSYATRENVINLTTGMPEVAMLSNISLDAGVREDFWKQVHATARVAGPDRLVLDPKGGSKKEWLSIAACERLPADIRAAAMEIRAGQLTRKVEFPMGKAKADELIEIMREATPKPDRSKGPVRFARGRNGRTQYRLETEFPDGLDAAARYRIMVRVAGRIEDVGGMYTAAIHEPDEHNDSRNFHLHVVAHDRPAKLVNGVWDFAEREQVPNQKGRSRVKDKKRKVQIDALATNRRRGDFEAFLKMLRAEYAVFCNEELEAAGLSRQFDPRTYKAMGIDRQPTKPLGTRLAPLEAVGIPTTVGIRNAEIIWNHRLQARLAECRKRQTARAAKIEELQATVASMAADDENRAKHLRSLEAARQASTFLSSAEADLATYEVTLELARARPDKTIDTCSRILEKVAAGKATPSDRKNQPLIAERLKRAEIYLREILAIERSNQATIEGQRRLMDDARDRFELATSLDGSRGQPELVAAPITPPKPIEEVQQKAEVNSMRPCEAAVGVPSAPSPPAGNQSALTLDTIADRFLKECIVVVGPEYTEDGDFEIHGWTDEERKFLQHRENIEEAAEMLAKVADKQIYQIKGNMLAVRARGEHAHREREFLKSFEAHPIVDRWLNPTVAEPEERISLWTRMRSMLPGSRGEGAIPSVPESTSDVAATPAQAASEVGPSIDHQKARQDAITNYAKFLRESRSIKLVEVDGSTQVDPESAGDWRRSAEAFADEPEVLEAVAYRRAQAERRANKEREIQQALSDGDLQARMGRYGWVITGNNTALVKLANLWANLPSLQHAFAEGQQREVAKTQYSHQLSGLSVVTPTMDAAPGAAIAREPATERSSPVSPHEDVVAIETQHAFLNNLRQRGALK